jgi:hypothetical protein
MHMLCGVIVPSGTTLDEAHDLVAALMEPHREVYPDDEDAEPVGWWDSWQIGGRYVGRYSDYDPRQDPANFEVCRLCGGTGERSDGLSGPGNCNGCCGTNGDKPRTLRGTGRAMLWPTQWKPCPDDVVPVKVLVNNPGIGLPLRVVFPDGTATDERPWANPGDLVELLRPHEDHALVVVDYHA